MINLFEGSRGTLGFLRGPSDVPRKLRRHRRYEVACTYFRGYGMVGGAEKIFGHKDHLRDGVMPLVGSAMMMVGRC